MLRLQTVHQSYSFQSRFFKFQFSLENFEEKENSFFVQPFFSDTHFFMKMVEKNDTKCFVYQQGNPYLQIAGFLMPAFFGRRQEQETTFHHITVANVIISQKYQNWSKYHTH